MDDLNKQVVELTKRIEALESNKSQVKVKREKRPPTKKQEEQRARFKKAYEHWAPLLKKDDPSLKSHEIFKMVHAKLKEEK